MSRSASVVLFAIFLAAWSGSAAWGINCSHQCSGTPINCTAASTCNSGSDWIQCDSSPKIYCTPCTVVCQSDPQYQCYSQQRVCDQGWDGVFWISCNGYRIDCPPCANPWEIYCTS